jgi:hypothetical protein
MGPPTLVAVRAAVHVDAQPPEAEPSARDKGENMRRRTLDILFSVGGVGLAALLGIIGLVLTSNANFAKDYVRDQLSEQRISFPRAADLTDEEKKSECLVTYAGQALTTGKQAECYANEFIGAHLRGIPNADGRTYAELGTVQTELRTQISDAQRTGDPGLTSLQKQLTDITSARETVFKGETLRGLLLTSYGFSVLGVKGEQVATVAYIGAVVLALLAIAGLVHAFVTPKTAAFAAPSTPDGFEVPRAREPSTTR